MKIGKYIVTTKSAYIGERGYVATADLIWEENDATWETSIHFHQAFATGADAETHALREVHLRLADGRL